MATAGITGSGESVAVSGTFENLYDRSTHNGKCTTIEIRNNTGGGTLFVNCPEMHGPDGYATVPAGEKLLLRSYTYIEEVNARASGSVCTVDWYGAALVPPAKILR